MLSRLQNWMEMKMKNLNESSEPVKIHSVQSVKPLTPSSTSWQMTLSPSSKWANRFIIAAIVQGALAAGLTAWLLYDATYDTPGAAKIVASGGGGTWLTEGYLAYIMFGPLAIAVTALFYQHLEVNLRAPYKGWSNIFAWLHLVLMNVGVVAGTWLMMNGGWRAGALAYSLGQQTPPLSPGQIAGQVHVQVLSGYPGYIAPFAAIAILGAFAGGIGYVVTWRRALKKPVTVND
jgi:hypothetical protein